MILNISGAKSFGLLVSNDGFAIIFDSYYICIERCISIYYGSHDNIKWLNYMCVMSNNIVFTLLYLISVVKTG